MSTSSVNSQNTVPAETRDPGEQADASTTEPAATSSSTEILDHTARLRHRLEALQKDARALSNVLPGAVAASTKGGGLVEALTPAVERSLTSSVRREPRAMADILAPVMGRACRHAFFGFFRNAILDLNFWILTHLSWHSVKWRMEAQRTGEPFRDIVARNTHATPVRQVFLIHRETGILLEEAKSPRADVPQDWDIVSGMLTALQDFVHDSFKMDRHKPLDSIRIGNVTVMLEEGPHAVLAGILDGDMTPDLRNRFREAVDRIHAKLSAALEQFSGNTQPFEAARPHLESCLEALIDRRRMGILPQTWLALMLPVALFGAWLLPGISERVRWNAYTGQLSNEPGIIIIDSGRKNGTFYITGLRDPLAAKPQDLLVQAGFTPEAVNSHWEPFQGLSSTLALTRARKRLSPPEHVRMSMRDDTLILEGRAPGEWISQTRAALAQWSEFSQVDISQLTASDAEKEQKWKNLLRRLDAEPGVMVMRSRATPDGGFELAGLLDPFAVPPLKLLQAEGLEATDVKMQWEPFQSSAPKIALERARQLLRPPQSVSLDVLDEVLRLEGKAPFSWISRAELLAPGIPGIRAIHTELLVDTDLRDMQEAQAVLESLTFKLFVGSPELWPGQEEPFSDMVEAIDKLRRSAKRRDTDFTVEIRGYVEPSGNAARDEALSRSVARSFEAILRQRALDTRLFTERGMGATPKATSKARLVTLSVSVMDY